MPRKAFEVKVELDIQSITCPGVWLCPNGKISLQLYMLGSCIQTTSREPLFPILCHETFIFYKTFHNVHRLSNLQKLLSKEWIYAELIQWENCEYGNVLATFKTTLSELLYPNIKDGAVPGVDIDLLMEPTKNFPGIIAPKMEVSTRTTIEEKLCISEDTTCEPYVVNPKVLTSKSHCKPSVFRQRKVCHSAGYHRRTKTCEKSQPGKKEIFLYRRVDDNLIARQPQGLKITENYCNCRSNKKQSSNTITPNASPLFERRNKSNTKWVRKLNPKNPETSCNHGEVHGDCPICSKYKYYFESQESTSCRTRAEAVSKSVDPKPRCATHPNKICLCPMTKDDIKSTRECPNSHTSSCNCNPDELCRCFCVLSSPRKSLATRLHEKLSRCLRCPECPTSENQRPVIRNYRKPSPICESSCTPMQCQLNEDVLSEKCSDWYGNFDRFYKNFYKDKRNQCDRYIAC